MDASIAHNLDSLIGPPSETIDISEFEHSASQIENSVLLRAIKSGQTAEENLNDIVEDCSFSDIQKELKDIWDDPALSAHMLKKHGNALTALYKATKPTRIKARKLLPEPEQLPPELLRLKKAFDDVKLECWKTRMELSWFLRTPKNSDYNSLGKAKVSTVSSSVLDGNHAILNVTIHKRLSWGASYLTRESQHVLTSCQTLQDLCYAVQCPLTNMPLLDRGLIDSKAQEDAMRHEWIVCIEDKIYSCEKSDAEQGSFFRHIAKVSSETPSLKQGSTSLEKTSISSLSLRVSEPYWMLHLGNCEHFFVIDQIRLRHPSDPVVGYPITVQVTPTQLDLCRACAKVPASLSIIEDIRLGESPCVMCGPCWNNIRTSEDSQVIIVPLPTY